MDLKDLLDILPQLFNLFVPGFIFLRIYKYFVDTADKDFNVTTVGSIVVSYIFHLISTLIANWLNASEIACTILTIGLSTISALIFVKIRLTETYQKLIISIGKITGSKNIWEVFFNCNKGTRIRFFSKYNNQDVVIEGDVKFFDALEDGECNIVIFNYVIKYDNGNIYKSNDDSSTLLFNTKNIHGLEAHYGQ